MNNTKKNQTAKKQQNSIAHSKTDKHRSTAKTILPVCSMCLCANMSMHSEYML